jgi:formylglycine-generating enzyme required for sulfatase activity
VILQQLVALAFLGLSPATWQAAFIQQPDTEAPTATKDHRRLVRQTPGGVAQEPPAGMVLIPAGTVVIGTPVEKVESLGQRDVVQMTEILAETPRHSVEVDPFYIDLTEVTNLQWKAFLDATGREPTATLVEFNWPNGEIPAGQELHPVTNVNIPEIREYLAWCGRRLPTEQEWVRAARGDDEREYPWGDRWNDKWCKSARSAPQLSEAVGSYPDGTSPFGLLDMAGNVFEWVDSPFAAFDGFEAMRYGKGKRAATLTPSFNSTWRIIKGGAYTTVRQYTRIDTRIGMLGVESDEALGFRTARAEKPGVESIRHALQRLLPPDLIKPGLDEEDIFCREVEDYDPGTQVITSYRSLAFAHRAPERGSPLSKLRRSTRDEPLPLGILFTSEPLRMPHMDNTNGAGQFVLSSGEYALYFKAEGESKAYKERMREERKNGSSKPRTADKEKDEGAEGENGEQPAADGAVAAATESLGAAVPWPGIGSIHDIHEDIEFPQDVDVILLTNANHVVVGWLPAGEITDEEIAPLAATRSADGRQFAVSFSINQVLGKRGPRFTLNLELAGEGL